jgi:hypothetical protein
MILLHHVIPAKAGIHILEDRESRATLRLWTPASAGVTTLVLDGART